MNVPGSNLFKMAMRLLQKQTVQYFSVASRELNAIGQHVAIYNDPVNILGSFQPIPRSVYEQQGLDLQKNYATFYAAQELIDVRRDMSPDKIIFNGITWQCLSSNDWFGVDGWVGILCVEVPT